MLPSFSGLKWLLNSTFKSFKIAEKEKPVESSTGLISGKTSLNVRESEPPDQPLKGSSKPPIINKDSTMPNNTRDQNSDQAKLSSDQYYPIEAPNYTQIPNVIFDQWMSKLTPGEFKVLLCICRKTFGWQKRYDAISLRQIMDMTGLSKEGVIKTISSLLEKNLIVKRKSKSPDGDDATNQYEINVKSGGSQLSLPPLVNSVDYRVVNSVDTQKKDITKERQTKEKGGVGDLKKKAEPIGSVSSPPANDLFVFFLDLLKKRNPKMKDPDRKRWLAEIDKIMRIDKRTVEELKAVLTWAFNQEDVFWPNAIQSPVTLRKLFDRAWSKMHHKSKAQKEKDKNAQKLRRIEENREWATILLSRTRFNVHGQKMTISDNCIHIHNGREFMTIGYAEINFREIIISKLRSWGYDMFNAKMFENS